MLRRRIAAVLAGGWQKAQDEPASSSEGAYLSSSHRRRSSCALAAAQPRRLPAARRWQGGWLWLLSILASACLVVGSSSSDDGPTEPPPPEYSTQVWEEFTDPVTGRPYWYNAVTNSSSWMKPGLPPLPAGNPPPEPETTQAPTTEAPNYTSWALVIMCTIIGICVTCVTGLFIVDCYCYPSKALDDAEGEEGEGTEEGGGDAEG